MSYLRYLCLFAYSGVQHILRCVLFNLSSSCASNVASFYGLSVLIAPSVFYNVYIFIYVCVFIYYCYCCSTGIWYQKSYILVGDQS